MDARLSSAIHTLIMIAGTDSPMSSAQIAQSVGTNASYIRKIAGLLKGHGIIESRQGSKGFTLLVPPEKLSLYQVYEAVSESREVNVFDLHQNPSDHCIVGRHIKPVLSDVFRGIDEAAERELRATTLADCMERLKAEIDREEKA
ncbi:MAG: Rrf2 family transcriptional regulator [Coriobacteriales bacterium]|nr:Rrf2 family transcriptional regulator [Coriobacteriales bacterium]